MNRPVANRSTPARSAAMLLALLVAGTPMMAIAATPIDETRPLDPRGTVDIENLKGRIQVRAWERNEVKVTGTLGDNVERLIVEGDRNHLQVKAKYPEGRSWGDTKRTGPTTLILQVPLQASLDIESVSADIEVDGIASPELDIESVSGDVAVAGAPGRADIETVSGNQALTLNSDGEVSAESVSGDVTLRGRLKGELDLETVSGNMQIDSVGEAVRSLSIGTVSGDIGARVGLARGGEIRAETVSGDLRLQLARGSSARVSAESFSGDLEAPGAQVRKERFGPGSSLEASFGGGDGRIRVETFSGDFTLSLD